MGPEEKKRKKVGEVHNGRPCHPEGWVRSSDAGEVEEAPSTMHCGESTERHENGVKANGPRVRREGISGRALSHALSSSMSWHKMSKDTFFLN